ncbi:MAG: ABC transporter permease [Verrucomicrobiota bacterium]
MSTSTLTESKKDEKNPLQEPKKESVFNVNKVAHTLDKLGLGFFTPFVRLAAGDEPEKQIRQIVISIVLPIVAIGGFMALWTFAADKVKTDSMKIPSPSETWSAWKGIHEFAVTEDKKAVDFKGRMEKLALKAEGKGDTEKAAKYRAREYVGPPTFYTQVWISLFTVAVGFFAATFIAVPIGIMCGLSKYVNIALNPLIQIFKPVSPLAWLPIVFVFVTALYTPAEGEQLLTRALFISAGTVTLCSLWPTLINTAFGVAGIDKDHLNVAKVLKLSWWQRIWKIVLPASLPLMFTGLRLSLGVGWMVLVAADMLAQNPGLGKFVWDTFQNGSTESMAQIVCAVFWIGAIGFVLDRIMFVLQKLVSFEEQAI